MHTDPSVWVVDDDPAIRSYLSDFLVSRGYGALCLDSGEQVVRRLASSEPPALLLLDIRMPRVGGLEILAEMEKQRWRIPSIMLSGLDQVPTVVKAMRLGASDYLIKPIDEKDLAAAIRRALDQDGEAETWNSSLRETALRSSNPKMIRVRSICDQVAHADVPVLILGESGVGKEVVARYLHSRSASSEPFVKVNCAALPADLLESELF